VQIEVTRWSTEEEAEQFRGVLQNDGRSMDYDLTLIELELAGAVEGCEDEVGTHQNWCSDVSGTGVRK
jgi:hypothetical protein